MRIYVYPDDKALVPLLFVDYAHKDAPLESGHVHYVFSNHLGCPERVTDVTGKTVWAASIAPYGATTIHERAEFHQPLRWPGHYCDAETGLHYNRFRYYDPSLGRYLQSDPAGISGGYNLYAYTENPLRQVDVRGLHCPGEGKEKRAEEEDGPETEAVAVGDVDSYAALKRRAVVGDGVEHDHIPSKVAVRDAINAQRKKVGLRPLDPAQVKRLNNRLTAVEVPAAMHRAGRTHGSKNSADVRMQDANDLPGAVDRDMPVASFLGGRRRGAAASAAAHGRVSNARGAARHRSRHVLSPWEILGGSASGALTRSRAERLSPNLMTSMLEVATPIRSARM